MQQENEVEGKQTQETAKDTAGETAGERRDTRVSRTVSKRSFSTIRKISAFTL